MRAPNGFTIIEVILALVILIVVLVGLAQTTGRTVHTVATSDRQEAAVQLVHDRIEFVRADPRYTKLDSLYEGTEGSFATLPGVQRATRIERITTAGNDYRTITVTVTGPGLKAPVSRTVTVGAP
jgi:Tfp pilus assembly protein PilV